MSDKQFDAVAFVNTLDGKTPDEQKEAFEKLSSNTQKKKVRSEMAARAAARALAEKSGVPDDDETASEPVEFAPLPTTQAGSSKGKQPVGKGKDDEVEEGDLKDMWNKVDLFDVTTIDPESLRIFEYEGFNPDLVLKTLMEGMKRNKISQASFLRDIMIMCGMAVIKGTVNDKNYKKMKKAGQDEFMRLESLYGLVRGGGKNMAAEKVTIARIAATFPGKILQLLQTKRVQPREYHANEI